MTKKRLLLWAITQRVSFDNDTAPSHAAPKNWAWMRTEGSAWVLVRVVPFVDARNSDNVLTENEVQEHVRKLRGDICEIFSIGRRSADEYILKARRAFL